MVGNYSKAEVNRPNGSKPLLNYTAFSKCLYLPLDCSSLHDVVVFGSAVLRNAPHLNIVETVKGLHIERANVADYIDVSTADMTAIHLKCEKKVTFSGRNLVIKASEIGNILVDFRENADGDVTHKKRSIVIKNSTIKCLDVYIRQPDAHEIFPTMGSTKPQTREYTNAHGFSLKLINTIVEQVQALGARKYNSRHI